MHLEIKTERLRNILFTKISILSVVTSPLGMLASTFFIASTLWIIALYQFTFGAIDAAVTDITASGLYFIGSCSVFGLSVAMLITFCYQSIVGHCICRRKLSFALHLFLQYTFVYLFIIASVIFAVLFYHEISGHWISVYLTTIADILLTPTQLDDIMFDCYVLRREDTENLSGIYLFASKQIVCAIYAFGVLSCVYIAKFAFGLTKRMFVWFKR